MNLSGRMLRSKDRYTAWMAVFLITLFFVGAQLFYIKFRAPYGFDEGVFWQTILSLGDGSKLYSEIFYAQLPLFIHWAKLLFDIGGQSIEAARLGIVITSAVAIPAMYLIGSRLAGAQTGLLAAFSMAINSSFFHSAHVLGGNAPSVAFLALSFALLLVAIPRPERIGSQSGRAIRAEPEIRGLPFFGAMLAMSISLQFKLIAIGALPAAYYLIYHCAGYRKRPNKKDFFLLLLKTTLIGALLVFGGVFIFDQQGLVFSQLNGGALSKDLVDNHALRPVYTLAEKAYIFFSNEWSYHRGNFLLPIACLVLLYQSSRRKVEHADATKLVLLFLPVLSLPLFVHPRAWPHHFVILSPLLCLALVILWMSTRETRAFGPFPGRVLNNLVRVFCLACVGLDLLLILLPIPKLEPRAEELFIKPFKEVTSALKNSTQSGDYVITDHQFIAASLGLRIPAAVIDTSGVRVGARSLTCAKLFKELLSGKVRAVLITKRLKRIDCGEENLYREVQRHFPIREDFGVGAVLFSRKRSS
ncbi:MAG: hypothetical protein AB1540_00855 [Bdellovibrionota bacterium]